MAYRGGGRASVGLDGGAGGGTDLVQREAAVLQKARLPRLLRPTPRRLRPEAAAADLARQRRPVVRASERALDQLGRHPLLFQLRGDAQRPLAPGGMPGREVLREAGL